MLILATGIYLTVRLKGMQIRKLPAALRYMVQNEEEGSGEVTSFGALCTAMSATIGTENIVGVATAIVAGGLGALFWMWIAALFGMATKYAEGVLAICYRSVDKETGHVLGGPFYYIENGMGKKWRWLGKIFAFFGAGGAVWKRVYGGRADRRTDFDNLCCTGGFGRIGAYCYRFPDYRAVYGCLLCGCMHYDFMCKCTKGSYGI